MKLADLWLVLCFVIASPHLPEDYAVALATVLVALVLISMFIERK